MFGIGKNQAEQPGARFAQLITPHLDAAYNLALWLSGDDGHAQDIAQDAIARAWQYFASFRGEEGRPWLLGIVRRVFFDWHSARGLQAMHEEPIDLETHQHVADESIWAESPERWASRLSDAEALNQALASLPVSYREVLVLRELEDLSYKEIARVIDAPVGTVMSRLARARKMMLLSLTDKGMNANERKG